MSDALAYFITFHTYGTWLPGRAEGSVDDEHRVYGQPFASADEARQVRSAKAMPSDAILLTRPMADEVLSAVLETCRYREWPIHAVHVRSTHLHAVLSAASVTPEKVMTDLKAYATRALRRAGYVEAKGRVWTRHGSTRHVWDEMALAEKVEYTLDAQGVPMARWPESVEHQT